MTKLMNYGLTRDEYKKCIPFIYEKTHTMCGIIIRLSAILVSIVAIVSLFFEPLEKLIPIYFCFAVIMIVASLIHKFIKRNWLSLELIIVMGLCLGFSATLSFKISAEKSTIFPLILVGLPTLFTHKFRNLVIFLPLASILYIFLSFFYKADAIWFWETYNIIVLTILSIIVHWLVSRERCLGYLSMALNEEMILKLEKTQEELQYLSENDVLSGLSNRRKLFVTMAQIEKKEIEIPNGVLMLDIDDFKKYNDTYGHAYGDKVIHSFGSMLNKFALTHKIKFYRYGGEEFVGLFWCEDKNHLNKVANEVCESVRNLRLEKSSITVSIGSVFCDSENLNYEYWIALADKALYTSKSSGKNCVCCWNDSKK